MPLINVEVKELTESVTRPLLTEVIRDIMTRTGIDPKTRVVFNRPNGEALSPGSVMGESEEETQFSQDSLVQVQVTEEFSEEAYSLSTFLTQEQKPIFVDEALDIKLTPFYVTTTASVEFTKRFDSEAAANGWRNGILRRTAAEAGVHTHHGRYVYPIPDECMYILMKLHETRENNQGYGDTLGGYYKAHFDDRVTVIANSAGGNKTFAVEERQVGMVGQYEFTEIPKPTKEETQWTVSFGYKVTFDKPNSFIMKYPVIVHNQRIPDNLLNVGHNLNILGADDTAYKSLSKSRFDALMRSNYVMPGETIGGISVPSWDEWIPERTYTDHGTLMRILIHIDSNDPRALIDLDSLGGITIKPLFREYLAKNHLAITYPLANPFLVLLFEDGQLMDHESVEVDEFLEVRTTFDMDERKVYHLWIGLNANLASLSEQAAEQLRLNGDVFAGLINILDPYYRGDLTTLPDGRMSRTNYHNAVSRIRKSNKHFKTKREINRVTVGNFAVQVRRS